MATHVNSVNLVFVLNEGSRVRVFFCWQTIVFSTLCGMISLNTLLHSEAVAGQSRPYTSEFFSGSLASSDSTPFLLNPATLPFARSNGHLTLLTGGLSSRLEQLDNGIIERTDRSQTELEGVGLSWSMPIDAGLAVGVVHERLFRGEENSFDDNEAQLENFRQEMTRVRASLALSEQLFAGLQLAFLETSASVDGANFVSESTVYSGSLLGFGVGGLFRYQEQFAIGAAYRWPLRGKTEIRSEQTLLTETGIVEWTAHYRFEQAPVEGLKVGLLWRRFNYDRDDRSQPTGLGDADNTQIDLRGLSPERFYLSAEQRGLGLAYPMEQIELRLDVLFERGEVITSATEVPRLDSDQVLNSTTPSASVRFINDQVQLELRLSYFKREQEFAFNDSGPTRRYAAQGRVWTIMGSANLD